MFSPDLFLTFVAQLNEVVTLDTNLICVNTCLIIQSFYDILSFLFFPVRLESVLRYI